MDPSRAEIEGVIGELYIRSGAAPDLRRRERLMIWLLENGEASFLTVLSRAKTKPDDIVLLDMLGRFRRPEATRTLLAAFENPRLRLTAASGLGLSPDPVAHSALLNYLDSADPKIVVAALSGLGANPEAVDCAHILPKIRAENSEVRWMAIEVGSRFGCLDDATLSSIASGDQDADVRALATDKGLHRHERP